MTVSSLRKEGFKVKVTHRRYWQDPIFRTPLNKTPTALFEEDDYIYSDFASPRGGETQVELEKDGIRVVGVSKCSKKDGYNKKRGVQIAIGRALSQLPERFV
jgi:hypothetical protein